MAQGYLRHFAVTGLTDFPPRRGFVQRYQGQISNCCIALDLRWARSQSSPKTAFCLITSMHDDSKLEIVGPVDAKPIHA